MNAGLPKEITTKSARLAVLFYSLIAVAAFQLAFSFPSCAFLIAVYLWCLFQLTALPCRHSFYLGLSLGALTFAPQLNFMWTIFGPTAIVLWYVISFWTGLFLFLGQKSRANFKSIYSVLLIPFLWMGLEYFRSELYYLRFSWLSVGYAFAQNPATMLFHFLGVYGIGFALMLLIAAFSLLPSPARWIVNVIALALLGTATNLPFANPTATESAKTLRVAGVQLEFPSEEHVLLFLKRLTQKYPDAQLLVLSEYTFTGPVPKSIRDWCRNNHRYVVMGGEDPVSDSQYYNTAFVIGPAGETVFRQAKSVPIQFFKDGLPAKNQTLWDSPWGKIGFCICYDLSYSRVTDQLARLGAEAIIVPTMDVADWGRHQHNLHALIAPARAAEYGVPIFRLASSGISQCVNAAGRVTATAPMPGNGTTLSGTLALGQPGSPPWDRSLAKISVVITALIIVQIILMRLRPTQTCLPKSDQP